MTRDLAGRVIRMTGATDGIGKAAAVEKVARCAVPAADRTDGSPLGWNVRRIGKRSWLH